MTRTTGLIVIVGALSLIGITLWFLADEGPSTETPTTTSIATDGGPTEDATPPELPVADSAGERPVQSLDTAAVDASPDVAQTTVATPTVLPGRVTRAGDGRPVAGVEVSARLSPAGGATAATPVAVTDADGVYSIEPGHGGTLVRLDVASGPDTTRTTLRTERAVPEGERTTVDVEVTKGVALAGTVVDGDGRPVADAEVRAWTGARFTIERERSDAPDRVVRTDAAGSFEVVAVGPRFLLEARAEGSVAADRLHGEIPVGKRAAGLVLHVSPTRSLRVEVRGRDGRTLASASVVARHALHGASEKITDFEGVFRSGPRQISGTTDADGRAELPDLASLVYDVEVEHGSHAPWSGQHAPGDPDLLVRLDPGALLFGTVTDVGGAGISQAQVQVSSADHSLMDRNSRRTRSDEDGRFEFGGLLTDDAALLSVAAPGHAVRVVEGLPVHEDTPREVRVILGPEYALAGLVTDPTGTPVAKALVEIEGDRLIDFGPPGQPVRRPVPREGHAPGGRRDRGGAGRALRRRRAARRARSGRHRRRHAGRQGAGCAHGSPDHGVPGHPDDPVRGGRPGRHLAHRRRRTGPLPGLRPGARSDAGGRAGQGLRPLDADAA
jgi:protocatechuate 3,4-dioxygenase beta subunit